MASNGAHDIEFFFDPVCPFAWVASRWIADVADLSDYRVRWRFISLRVLNEDVGYEGRPDFYPEAHMRGHRMLRVAAAARDRHGDDIVGDLYTGFGTGVHIEGRLLNPEADLDVSEILDARGLDSDLAGALDDEVWDETIGAETQDALARVGDDLGTPIITFHPPDGASFFGPVISRIPPREKALELWEAVLRLATWPSFAELKRSLREPPQPVRADDA